MTDLLENLWFPALFVALSIAWIVLVLMGMSRRRGGTTVVEAPEDRPVLVVPHHGQPGDNQLNRDN